MIHTFPPAAVGDPDPLLTVIVPVFNERETVAEILMRVQSVPVSKEVLVVDDGSTDGTAEILAGIQAENLRVFRHERNRGKGAAIRTALAHARGRITIIQDADLEYDPRDYPILIQPILSGTATVVYGSRYRYNPHVRSHLAFLWGGRLVSWVTNRLYRTRLSDEPCCYKVMPTDLLRGLGLKCERFEFCPEVTARVARRGIPIHEIPVRYYPRKKEEGKKIGARDGIEAILTLLRLRFGRLE